MGWKTSYNSGYCMRKNPPNYCTVLLSATGKKLSIANESVIEILGKVCSLIIFNSKMLNFKTNMIWKYFDPYIFPMNMSAALANMLREYMPLKR
jgi:hypothetical protein